MFQIGSVDTLDQIMTDCNAMLGDLAIAVGKPEKAEAFYKKAAAPWPDSTMRLALSRGRGFVAQKKYEDAIKIIFAIIHSRYNL